MGKRQDAGECVGFSRLCPASINQSCLGDSTIMKIAKILWVFKRPSSGANMNELSSGSLRKTDRERFFYTIPPGIPWTHEDDKINLNTLASKDALTPSIKSLKKKNQTFNIKPTLFLNGILQTSEEVGKEELPEALPTCHRSRKAVDGPVLLFPRPKTQTSPSSDVNQDFQSLGILRSKKYLKPNAGSIMSLQSADWGLHQLAFGP